MTPELAEIMIVEIADVHGLDVEYMSVGVDYLAFTVKGCDNAYQDNYKHGVDPDIMQYRLYNTMNRIRANK